MQSTHKGDGGNEGINSAESEKYSVLRFDGLIDLIPPVTGKSSDAEIDRRKIE